MTIQILSIGNSFSQDAQRYLHVLAKNEGVDMQTVNLYIGGCALEKHFRNLKGDKREYTLEVNGQSAEGFMTSIREALTARNWDVVTLQQASHESYREETYQPYLKLLADFVRENCPKAKLFLQQTWGYESGSERIRQHGFETYDEMFEQVMCCYDKAAEAVGADGVIPAGLAFQYALEKGIGRIHRDTFHASFGAGRFLLALVWYGYITGNDISHVRFQQFDEEVDDREYGIIIEAAENSIQKGRQLQYRKQLTLSGNAPKYHPENMKPVESSPLRDKRLLFLGSSVTYGSAALGVSMADYIRVLDGCEVVKEAVSGTTLADRDKDSYLSRLKRVDINQKFDVVVCQLSTNDATQKIPLGSVSNFVEPDTFDTATVVGSMESIIAYVQDTWNCPLVFYTGTKYDSAEYQAMVDILPLLQAKWGICVLDLWNDDGMNGVAEDDYALYMNDEIHPTQAGYLLWWTPKFQDFLYGLPSMQKDSSTALPLS